jgi:AraC-like DNA-binding protein
LEVDDVEDPVGLQMGDVVLLITGRGHRLCDDLSSNTEWLDDSIQKTPPARHEPGPSRTSRPSLPCPDPRSPQSFASSRANRQCATSAAADSPSLFHATTDLTVFAVAQRVGYDSEASLTKAFTRMLGVAPGGYRRRSREHSASELVRPVEVPADGDEAPTG